MEGRSEASGVKRPAEEHQPEYDHRAIKFQAVSDEAGNSVMGMWKSKSRESWPWKIEGELSQRWKLRKGVVLDLGTRDEEGEAWNFDDEAKRSREGFAVAR